MNCIESTLRNADRHSEHIALLTPRGEPVSFAAFLDAAERTQTGLRALGIGPGDTVLLLDVLGARLYSTVLAVLSVGGAVMLVEPWMPLVQIEQAVSALRPSLFVTHPLGRLWGIRVRAVRNIPRWTGAARLLRNPRRRSLEVASVEASHPAIFTFTSGTGGSPKGVVRTHGLLQSQHEVLHGALDLDSHPGPDLCIFANFVLDNLASGRTTVLIKPPWRASDLASIDRLDGPLRPTTLTCGPAFLTRLMCCAQVRSLRSIHVGGALTDCQTFEKAFSRWPDAALTHVYGSTEAEPVCVCDARVAVRASRDCGHYQTLYLGRPVPEIASRVEEEGLWVSGPHVCTRYVGDIEEGRTHKRRDPTGTVWHFMGDRVRTDSRTGAGWWYDGRAWQRREDFELEQLVYSRLGSSNSFIHRNRHGELALVGENVEGLDRSVDSRLESIDRLVETRVYRDRRHRARIDRTETLARGPKWLLG